MNDVPLAQKTYRSADYQAGYQEGFDDGEHKERNRLGQYVCTSTGMYWKDVALARLDIIHQLQSQLSEMHRKQSEGWRG